MVAHPTAEPQNVGVDVQANRLASDLESLDNIRVSDVNKWTDGIVRFDVTEERTSFPPSVMRVLVEHNAALSGGCLAGPSIDMNEWRAIVDGEH